MHSETGLEEGQVKDRQRQKAEAEEFPLFLFLVVEKLVVDQKDGVN